MTALAPRGPRTARPTWGQSFWAVVGGSLFAWCASLLVFLPLDLIGVPIQFTDGTTGLGWPYRIEGPWSLAADVGPLLLAGYVFAFGVGSFLQRHTDIAAPLTPLAVAAAALGWVMIGNVSHSGLLEVSGLAAFIALVVVAREASVREGRWRWTRPWALLTLIAALGLTAATLSYGFLHPLSAGTAELSSLKDGRANVTVYLHNDGRADVRLVDVTLPDVNAVAKVYRDGEYAPGDLDSLSVPIDGLVLKRDVSSSSGPIELTLPARCPSSRSLDRVVVRLRVHGRTLDQVVRFPPVAVGCVG